MISLDAPYLDTSAQQLCFSLDQDERPALAERTVTVGGLAVRLRLLGASHQVFAGPVRETVACLRGGVRGLPATYTHRLPGWSYLFSARTRPLARREFSAEVARILDRAAGDDSLCGIFPGSPEAVTAVTVERAGAEVAWRTWHTYPQDGQIVSTYSRLEAR